MKLGWWRDCLLCKGPAVLELVLGLCHCASSLCRVHPVKLGPYRSWGFVHVLLYRPFGFCGVNLVFSIRGNPDCSKETFGRVILLMSGCSAGTMSSIGKLRLLFWLSAVSILAYLMEQKKTSKALLNSLLSVSRLRNCALKKRNRRRKVTFQKPIEQLNDSSRHDRKKNIGRQASVYCTLKQLQLGRHIT